MFKEWQQIEQMLVRSRQLQPAEEVADIIDNVRKRGDEALFTYTSQFDGARLKGLRVTSREIEEAVRSIPETLLASLEAAALRIRRFHEHQQESGWEFSPEPGVRLGQLIRPIDSAGIYIPGGKAAYPSSVLMNALPAVLAGVPRIVMVTPPAEDGRIPAAVLAAARLCGIEEIYKVGGAQAIAALAYGTETIRKVNKITGPGNAYVACAKRQVFGDVSIDMVAGPSEVCIWADDDADPSFVAADLLAQAEHDERAMACCIVDSEVFGERVREEVDRQLKLLKRQRIAGAAMRDNGWIAVVPSEEEAVRLVNRLAPEHLEIMRREPGSRLTDIRNAGAIFLGGYSPEALGDYMAGPNHTLPTGGTAAFSSPLGVYDFLKRTSLVEFDAPALERVSHGVMTLAESEQLDGHANAIAIRKGGAAHETG